MPLVLVCTIKRSLKWCVRWMSRFHISAAWWSSWVIHARLVEYTQPARKRGLTKNNILTFYELAMQAVTSYSKVPLRLATFVGFGAALLSFLVGMFYLVYKLLFWQSFSLGLAPLAVGLFFFGSIQLFFLGILGEYVGAINSKMTRRPLVIEKERINF